MIVTEVHTPNSIWAQPVTTADTVRDFSAKMKDYFLTNPSALGLITPKRTMKVAAKLVPYSHTSVCHCILEFSYILPEHNTVLELYQQLIS